MPTGTVVNAFLSSNHVYMSKVVSSSKKRRVETPVGGLESEDNADYRPPEWRMELTRDGSVENESHSAIDNTKEKCCGDCSDKINDKPDIIK